MGSKTEDLPFRVASCSNRRAGPLASFFSPGARCELVRDRSVLLARSSRTADGPTLLVHRVSRQLIFGKDSANGKRRTELWWEVMQCDQFIGGGYPALQHPSSNQDGSPPFATGGQSQTRTLLTLKPRRKRRKKIPKEDPHAVNKKLLGLMNKNITTMRHLLVTHSKFSNLKESKEVANEEDGLALPGTSAAFGGPPDPIDFSGGPILTNLEPLSDINPWSQRLDEDCDFGPNEAENCLHWVGEKVLEHSGFQGRVISSASAPANAYLVPGTSKIALDMLTGVASEYLLNVGRTIQFLSEKYGKKMTSEVSLENATACSATFIPSTRKSSCIRCSRAASLEWGIWKSISRTMSSGTAAGCPSWGRNWTTHTRRS
jgi:hypothetical protein